MPCNTVVTNTVKLENVKDHDLLERALRAEFADVTRAGDLLRFRVPGAGYWVELFKGRATSRLPESQLQAVVGRVKQAYAREAVQAAAKRFGWAVVKGADANNFQLRKG